MKTVTILRNAEPIAKVWNANRYFSRLRGLLGRTLEEGGGLLLTPCNGIHTFGMRYEIDAVYLDRAGCVLRVDQALVRGKVWPMQRGARRVLELPAGYAAKRSIQAGDILEVVP
ncbi:MAG: DUF192 domain-containing protein [Clostridiales bacterium]|nr:DUF192 domain-containing protein [Clostridiales bacterium]